jgi:hypothetical protein
LPAVFGLGGVVVGDSEVVTGNQLLTNFDRQARNCARLGSPMYEQLLAQIIGDVQAGGVFAEVLAGHEDDP